MEELSLDYTAWDGSRRMWHSPEAFLSAGAVEDGVDSIQCGRVPIDLNLINTSRLADGSQKVLPVFFSGAVTARKGRRGPFFSGAGIAGKAGFAALCVADPSLAIDPDLELAWYAGSQAHNSQSLVRDVLAGLARMLDVELLLIGGSGGGFAALQHASHLAGLASALVWNPQTDLLRYYRPAVMAYLRRCWSGYEWRDQDVPALASERLASAGVEHSVIERFAAGHRPRRLLYLQNSADRFHVQQHAGPFFSQFDLLERGTGMYVNDDDRMAVWFGGWGRGHEPLPKTMLVELIEQMLDPRAAAALPAPWLNPGDGAPAAPQHPLPLSFRHSGRDAVIRVDSTRAEGTLRVCASLQGKPSGTCEPKYAFYVYVGEHKVYERWYQDAGEALFAPLPADLPIRVAVFAQDSLGERRRITVTIPAAG